VEAGSEQFDERAGEQHAERAQSTHDHHQQSTGDVRELARFFGVLRREIARERGDECRRQRAFGEQIACEVGDAVADAVGVERSARAEQPAQYAFANESGDTANGDAGGDDAG
jgi:hypothetical protein